MLAEPRIGANVPRPFFRVCVLGSGNKTICVSVSSLYCINWSNHKNVHCTNTYILEPTYDLDQNYRQGNVCHSCTMVRVVCALGLGRDLA